MHTLPVWLSPKRRTVARAIATFWVGAALAACGGDTAGINHMTNPTIIPGAPTAGTLGIQQPVMIAGTGSIPTGTTAGTAATVPTTGAAGVQGRNRRMGAGSGALPMGGFGSIPTGPTGTAGMDMSAAGSSAPPIDATGADRKTMDGVCTRWKADRQSLSEGTWSGSIDMCTVGDISADGRANALRLVNLYRWLADLPAVTTSPDFDKQAQACALMQNANMTLSHMPPSSWKCYMQEGATASGRCNISTGGGVSSVDGYMIDPGNDTTLGHRRWIMSNQYGPTGLGSTGKYSCMYTFGTMRGTKPWQAWPAPGIMPVQAISPQAGAFGGFGSNVDKTGWSVQADKIDFSAAKVTVTEDGMPKDVTLSQLMPGYGSQYAIKFIPNGWTTMAGKMYEVSVDGISSPIKYQIQMVDCK